VLSAIFKRKKQLARDLERALQSFRRHEHIDEVLPERPYVPRSCCTSPVFRPRPPPAKMAA
jgi:hypothetical protein